MTIEIGKVGTLDGEDKSVTITNNDIDVLTDILNHVIESEQDCFTVNLEEGNLDPAFGMTPEDWEKEVDKFFDDGELHYSDVQLEKIATISRGHVYCDAVRLQNRYML